MINFYLFIFVTVSMVNFSSYFQPPGFLLDLDSSNSNSVAPSNPTSTASSDLWGDFDSVPQKWGEIHSAFSLLALYKIMQHFFKIHCPLSGVPYLSLPSRATLLFCLGPSPSQHSLNETHLEQREQRTILLRYTPPSSLQLHVWVFRCSSASYLQFFFL